VFGAGRRQERRRPESTWLHRVVVEHAETLLLQARSAAVGIYWFLANVG
jgi:hypothetical protein